jgi:hypothetical protein
MVVRMVVRMVMVMILREVNVEFHSGDGGFLLMRNMQMVAAKLEFFQFAFESVGVHAQIQQRADEHVACDAADEVEI